MKTLTFILSGIFFWLSPRILLAQTNQQPNEKDIVFTQVEQMPAFKKGSFEEFAARNLEYPKDALERKISGKVYISFVVDENGKVLDAKVLKGVGYGCDEEALDLIHDSSGKWNAGVQGGQKVKVRMVQPIAFSLRNPAGH